MAKRNPEDPKVTKPAKAPAVGGKPESKPAEKVAPKAAPSKAPVAKSAAANATTPKRIAQTPPPVEAAKKPAPPPTAKSVKPPAAPKIQAASTPPLTSPAAKPAAPKVQAASAPAKATAPVPAPAPATAKKATVEKPSAEKAPIRPAAAKATPAEKPTAKKAESKPVAAKKAAPKAAAGKTSAGKAAKSKTTKAKPTKVKSASAKTPPKSKAVAPAPAVAFTSAGASVVAPPPAVSSVALAPAAPPPSYVAPRVTRELPNEYGDTKIVALVRDPEWVFLYWEVSSALRHRLGIPRGAHAKPMALRVYDVTGVHFDGLNAHSFYDLEINDLAASWYLRIPEPERAYVIDLGVYDDDGTFQVIARSNAVAVPPAGMSNALDAEWMNVTDEQFAEIFRMSGGARLRQQRGSGEFGRRQPEDLVAELRRQWVGSGMWSGASGAVQPAPQKRKGFWLEVGCDVIVYGSTEPGAKVTLQGREIQLSPDGRFHARFVFPDGVIDLPVKAVNEDGTETREIAPVVKRETH